MYGAPQDYQGGPQPGMMYDPAMGQQQPMYDPQAEFHDQMKAKKAQDKQKKQKLQQEKMLRSGQRTENDNMSCALILCGLSAIIFGLWIAPLCDGNWWNKTWHGLSIQRLDVQFGYATVKIATVCDTSYGTVALCEAVKKYDGTWDISELKAEMCNNLQDSCQMMQQMYVAGLAPQILLPAAAALQFLAITFLYFYWKVNQLPSVHANSRRLQMLSTAAGNIGFFFWFLVSPQAVQLPRYWVKEAGQESMGNSNVFGLVEAESFSAGWCVFVAAGAGGLSFLVLFFMLGLPASLKEPLPDEGDDEYTKFGNGSGAAYGGAYA